MYLPPLTREPDELDRVLMGITAKWHHERRMKEIRELDIDAWVREMA